VADGKAFQDRLALPPVSWFQVAGIEHLPPANRDWNSWGKVGQEHLDGPHLTVDEFVSTPGVS
jgi:hypothetical protein